MTSFLRRVLPPFFAGIFLTLAACTSTPKLNDAFLVLESHKFT